MRTSLEWIIGSVIDNYLSRNVFLHIFLRLQFFRLKSVYNNACEKKKEKKKVQQIFTTRKIFPLEKSRKKRNGSKSSLAPKKYSEKNQAINSPRARFGIFPWWCASSSIFAHAHPPRIHKNSRRRKEEGKEKKKSKVSPCATDRSLALVHATREKNEIES